MEKKEISKIDSITSLNQEDELIVYSKSKNKLVRIPFSALPLSTTSGKGLVGNGFLDKFDGRGLEKDQLYLIAEATDRYQNYCSLIMAGPNNSTPPIFAIGYFTNYLAVKPVVKTLINFRGVIPTVKFYFRFIEEENKYQFFIKPTVAATIFSKIDLYKSSAMKNILAKATVDENDLEELTIIE